MAKSHTPHDLPIISPDDIADYAKACEVGRQHAAQFAQSLKDKPYLSGSNQLGRLAARINFADESPSKGFAVGFFSHIERLISLGSQNLDLADDVARINSIYAATAVTETDE